MREGTCFSSRLTNRRHPQGLRRHGSRFACAAFAGFPPSLRKSEMASLTLSGDVPIAALLPGLYFQPAPQQGCDSGREEERGRFINCAPAYDYRQRLRRSGRPRTRAVCRVPGVAPEPIRV